MCGGFAGFPCAGAGKCVDVPNDGCDPNAGGADCPGQCVCVQNMMCTVGSHFDGSTTVCSCVSDSAADGGPSAQCTSDSECPAVGAPCQLCNDGGANCPQSYCVNGACTVKWTGCP
jgi:hypothetical protein